MVQDILNRISNAKGQLELTDPDILSAWLANINQAAREIYEQRDLLDQNISEIFDLSNTDTQILALPWYVHSPKKWRNVDTGAIFNASQQSARFQWYPNDFNDWIFVRRSPLCREILNTGPFLLKLRKVETSPVIVRIAGTTPQSSNHEEEVTIPAGTLEKYTTSNWISAVSISQDPHDYDITIYDIDENIISIVPNHLSSVIYNHYRREDDICPFNSEKASKIEVLFKPVFRPLLTVNSSFQCGDRYDDAIMWKTLEHDALLNKDDVAAANNAANMYNGKCESAIVALAMKSDTGDTKVDLGRNRFLSVQSEYCYQNRFFRWY